MHYAEFAEDEVGSFVGLYLVDGSQDWETLTEQAECCITCSDQGIRSQQVEGHRAKGWQTCKGMS